MRTIPALGFLEASDFAEMAADADIQADIRRKSGFAGEAVGRNRGCVNRPFSVPSALARGRLTSRAFPAHPLAQRFVARAGVRLHKSMAGVLARRRTWS
jgi:hypothetical protein